MCLFNRNSLFALDILVLSIGIKPELVCIFFKLISSITGITDIIGGNLTGLNQVRWAIGNTNGTNYAIVNGTNIEVESDTVASVIIPSISNLGITNSTYSGFSPVYTDFGNTYLCLNFICSIIFFFF